MVTIQARVEDGVTILEVIGRMVLREGERPLHDAAGEQLSQALAGGQSRSALLQETD